MSRNFRPTLSYRLLVAANALAYAAFFFMPQVEVVTSSVALSALELESYGGLISSSHPWAVATTLLVRIALLILLFFGLTLGFQVLVGATALSLVLKTIGGLSVMTAWDATALEVLTLLDGSLLAVTWYAIKGSRSSNAA